MESRFKVEVRVVRRWLKVPPPLPHRHWPLPCSLCTFQINGVYFISCINVCFMVWKQCVVLCVCLYAHVCACSPCKDKPKYSAFEFFFFCYLVGNGGCTDGGVEWLIFCVVCNTIDYFSFVQCLQWKFVAVQILLCCYSPSKMDGVCHTSPQQDSPFLKPL